MLDACNFIFLRNDYAMIMTLHRIAPESRTGMRVNEHMNMSPERLMCFIAEARRRGWAFISIDEMWAGLVANREMRKCIVLTSDDGYKDNYVYALDVLESENVPLCIYVATAFPDEQSKLWWYALEDAINTGDVPGDQACEALFMACRTELMFGHAHDYDLFFRRTFPDFDLDWSSYRQEYCLSWQEIRELSRHPLVTIGAHSVNHPVHSKLDIEELVREIDGSRKIIADQIQQQPEHYCYPFGGLAEANVREYRLVLELGFKTGVTTVPGFVTCAYRNRLASLPRVMLSPATAAADYFSFLGTLRHRIRTKFMN